MGTLILLLFSATILVAFQVKPSDLVINPDPTQPPKRDNKLTSSFINHTPLCDHVLHDKVFQVHAQHGKPTNAKFGFEHKSERGSPTTLQSVQIEYSDEY